MTAASSYYDIDAILAEEELIPCTTLFDFSHLAHLDPDAHSRDHFLSENSKVKMPLWAVKKWAMLGVVRLSLPRHYGRKARERLEADPGDADLRCVSFVLFDQPKRPNGFPPPPSMDVCFLQVLFFLLSLPQKTK